MKFEEKKRKKREREREKEKKKKIKRKKGKKMKKNILKSFYEFSLFCTNLQVVVSNNSSLTQTCSANRTAR